MDKSKVIERAAQWWADSLRKQLNPVSGDGFEDTMVEWARSKITLPTEDQIDAFQACLEDELVIFLNNKSWNESNPRWGSALRVIGVDWSPDKVLDNAAKKAGISTLFLPIKTNMWLGPDGVKVSCGHGGNIEII